MKILNLYAGIGGNRKLWGDTHEITSVEYREDIAAVYRHYFPGDTLIVGDAHQYLLDHYKEFDFIWASPPCQTHSRARFWGSKNNDNVETKYPDMKLWQEIIFLKHYFDGQWVVENVKPFYSALIPPNKIHGKHFFWSNFKIKNFKSEKSIKRVDENPDNFKKELGFDLSNFKIGIRKTQVYRNCVHPETGLHILNCAQGIFEQKQTNQISAFPDL
jgi:DNA (cytosine-5)-methyltransferase 1